MFTCYVDILYSFKGLYISYFPLVYLQMVFKSLNFTLLYGILNEIFKPGCGCLARGKRTKRQKEGRETRFEKAGGLWSALCIGWILVKCDHGFCTPVQMCLTQVMQGKGRREERGWNEWRNVTCLCQHPTVSVIITYYKHVPVKNKFKILDLGEGSMEFF